MNTLKRIDQFTWRLYSKGDINIDIYIDPPQQYDVVDMYISDAGMVNITRNYTHLVEDYPMGHGLFDIPLDALKQAFRVSTDEELANAICQLTDFEVQGIFDIGFHTLTSFLDQHNIAYRNDSFADNPFNDPDNWPIIKHMNL